MTNIRTDLEIAEDLRSLCQIIDEAIDRVNLILQRMQRIDEVRELIQDIDRASQNLEESERKLEQAQSDIEHLRNLPQALRQLGIHENFLPEVQHILDEVEQRRHWFEQALCDFQKNEQRVRELIQAIEVASQGLQQNQQLLQQIKTDCESKLQQLEQAQSDIEHLRNLPQALRQLGIHENFLPEVQHILDEVEQRRHWFEQALCDFQKNEQRVRELIQAIEVASQGLQQNQQLLQQIKTDCESKLQQLEQAQSDIEHLRNLPQALRQLGIHENFLPEVQRILNEIRESRRWFKQLLNELQANQQTIRRNLEEFNQEIIAVRDLENYLRNFQQYRSGRKLRNFLYQELGFAGLVIYILHLLKPRRRNR